MPSLFFGGWLSISQTWQICQWACIAEDNQQKKPYFKSFLAFPSSFPAFAVLNILLLPKISLRIILTNCLLNPRYLLILLLFQSSASISYFSTFSPKLRTSKWEYRLSCRRSFLLSRQWNWRWVRRQHWQSHSAENLQISLPSTQDNHCS